MQEKQIDWPKVSVYGFIVVVIILWFVIVLMMATAALADGGGSDDSYKIGVDTTVSPAEYRRLYLPVYTAGNNTHVTLQVDVAQTGGQGNDMFWIELLDNENMLLSMSYITAYEIYTAGTSTRAVTTYSFDLTLSRSEGWRDGVYWIVVEKDLPGNYWCWISYEYSYETDAPGMGGLVEMEIARVDNRIDNLEHAHQVLERELEGLTTQLKDVDELVMELRTRAAALEENETEIRSFLVELSTLIGSAQEQVDLAGIALEEALEDLNLSFYMQLRVLEDALTTQVALISEDLNDTTGRLNTMASRKYALETDVLILEDRVDDLTDLLVDTEANLTALEGGEPEESGGAGLGIVAGLISGAVTAVAISHRVGKKGGV